MTFLAAPDQKVALLVIPGWADAVLVLPVLLMLWSPQEPKQSLPMSSLSSRTFPMVLGMILEWKTGFE